MFSGPLAESLPTGRSSFIHQRYRSDSTASFAFYNESTDVQEDAVEDDEEVDYEEDDSLNGMNGYADPDEDMEMGRRYLISPSRRSSRRSTDVPLLRRHSSTSSDAGYGRGIRQSQKVYIASEDLTIAISGFNTSKRGFALYTFVCVATLGIGWLFMRWIPSWRVRLTGKPKPLFECDWVVIENQWGEREVHYVGKQEYGGSISSVFGNDEKASFRAYEDEDNDITIAELRTLDYRYVRLCFHPLKDKFLLGNSWKDPAWTTIEGLRNGLDADEKESRQQVFGENLIDIEDKSIGELLVDQVLHPFYVFQIASLILWANDEYYYYAAVIFIISVVGVGIEVTDLKKTMRQQRELSRFECDVRVLRSGFWRQVSSVDLVPGDVFEVTDPSLTQLPCDGLLLSGDCIMNESMLTGESVPVTKTPVTDESLALLNLSAATLDPSIARHVLSGGTRIVRARRPQPDSADQEAAALALVIRTGFNTTKGSLVRSVVFPKPSKFKFYRDSFRYIGFMACIATIGFFVSVFNFLRYGMHWSVIIIRALDLITIVVPPQLPAALTIGQAFALSRLKKKKIFCISPQRTNVAGRLDVMCFDKTGTLTEDGLDVLGVRLARGEGDEFSDISKDATDLFPGQTNGHVDYTDRVKQHMLFAMATCHALRVIDDEVVGDPLEVKMLEYTGWIFEEGESKAPIGEDEESHNLTPSVARPPPDLESLSTMGNGPTELGVLRSFEFVSHLRRQSVIVRQFGSQSGEVYVKGAPEALKEICKPESLPSDYDEVLHDYTQSGFRVIACATRHIKKLNWVKVQKMKREDAESELDFIGFIVFENKLKPSTAGIIDELGRANIRKVMCTGDNILTAISVARECHLIDRTAHCFVPYFAEGDYRTALSRLRWESADDPRFQLDENSLKPLPPPPEADASLPYDVSNIHNYSIALTGDVFRWIINFASERVLHEMLVVGQVYARMSPDEKHELVEKLQSIDYCCGFCGDGANDCGALKAADVGISLSEAEASVAAPFTSHIFDISCVPQVIREGRAALVTSFSCFKYISLYSMIQFTSVCICYAFATNLGDFQFLYIDLLLIIPISVFIGWTGPYPMLSRKRPTASLVSRKVLIPLIGQIVICVVVQVAAYFVVKDQSWFVLIFDTCKISLTGPLGSSRLFRTKTIQTRIIR